MNSIQSLKNNRAVVLDEQDLYIEKKIMMFSAPIVAKTRNGTERKTERKIANASIKLIYNTI